MDSAPPEGADVCAWAAVARRPLAGAARQEAMLALAARPGGVAAVELARLGLVGSVPEGDAYLVAFARVRLGYLASGKLFTGGADR